MLPHAAEVRPEITPHVKTVPSANGGFRCLMTLEIGVPLAPSGSMIAVDGERASEFAVVLVDTCQVAFPLPSPSTRSPSLLHMHSMCALSCAHTLAPLLFRAIHVAATWCFGPLPVQIQSTPSSSGQFLSTLYIRWRRALLRARLFARARGGDRPSAPIGRADCPVPAPGAPPADIYPPPFP